MMRFYFMKIFLVTMFAVSALLIARNTFAGERETLPYTKCEVTGEKVEDCLIGCQTKETCAKQDEAIEVLSKAEKVTFYVLDGDGVPDIRSNLGEYVQTDSKALSGDFAREVGLAFRNSLLSGNYFSFCFSPHHALSIKSQDHVYDYVLCYDCGQMAVYIDGSYSFVVPATGDPSYMNELVFKAGMVLPKRYVAQLEREKEGAP